MLYYYLCYNILFNKSVFCFFFLYAGADDRRHRRLNYMIDQRAGIIRQFYVPARSFPRFRKSYNMTCGHYDMRLYELPNDLKHHKLIFKNGF